MRLPAFVCLFRLDVWHFGCCLSDCFYLRFWLFLVFGFVWVVYGVLLLCLVLLIVNVCMLAYFV